MSCIIPALRLRFPLVVSVLFFANGPATGAHEPLVDANYPGGNILVERVERDTVFVKPDLRGIQEGQGWFYWNFRVQNGAGRNLRFRFSERNPIGVCGPAISQDGGVTWRWLGAEAVRKVPDHQAWEFSFAFIDAKEVRFSFAFPYLQSDLERFLARHRGNPALVLEELCLSRKGRRVELLRLGKLTGEPQYRLLLTARHHACESLANYELEGVMDAVLAQTPEGRAWREQAEVMVIPFMDKDGVEEGDQGKFRAPRDHNRDYDDKSIYPEVLALRRRVPAWLRDRPLVALDMHCPYISDQEISFVGSPDQEIWSRVMALSRLLESTQSGPLHYRVKDNIPYGSKWNVATAYGQGKSFAAWAGELPGVRIAATVEFPYAKSQGEVTAESARTFGRDLAHAILEFLKNERN